MKNKNRGVIVPILLIIIAVLLIGGGVYLYQDQKEGRSAIQIPVVTQSQTPSPSVTNKPTITIISPNGGEVFKQGSPITVKWSQNFSAPASISLMGDAGSVYNSTPALFNAGVNTLTIPANTNIATCNKTTCYVADGFKVRAMTDNQPGSGHAGEFMNDESNEYFVIIPQTGLQARAFLEQMQSQIGTNYMIDASTGTPPSFRVELPSDKFAQAGNYFSTQLGTPNHKYTTERGYGYENWHLLCMTTGLGAGASPSALPYVTCRDKVGAQTVDVVVKNIRNIDTDTRTFTWTIGNETMKVRMPMVVQNTSYQNGTFADFVKAILDTRYQTSTFKMNGELKENVFEVTTIQWILG